MGRLPGHQMPQLVRPLFMKETQSLQHVSVWCHTNPPTLLRQGGTRGKGSRRR